MPAHLAVLVAATLLFAWIPQGATGVPLEDQLSSDAEWYVTSMAASQDERLRRADRGFPLDIRPRGELAITGTLAKAASAAGIELPRWSVSLSVVLLTVFVAAVYFVVRETTRQDGAALSVALFSLVPVHALGGTTWGFQALGFLPRDFGLVCAMGVLWLYIRGVGRDSARLLVAAGALCGLLANIQSIVAAHLVLTLAVAELLRARRVTAPLLGAGAAFALMAAPAIADTLAKAAAAAPVDLEIMRMRHGYMMATPFGPALLRYLRRFVIYVVALGVLAFLLPRRQAADERLRAWWCIAISAAGLACVGVLLETYTAHAKYMLSRTSLYFTLAAMILLRVEGPIAAARLRVPRTVALAGVLALFAVQSNLPSVYRNVRAIADTREEREELLRIAGWLNAHTRADEVFAAPSTESADHAAMLRAYAARPTFVTYKDGGVSLVDGERGRRWLGEYRRLMEGMDAPSPAGLLAWMRREGIAAAVVPRLGSVGRAPEAAAAAAHLEPHFMVFADRPRAVAVRQNSP